MKDKFFKQYIRDNNNNPIGVMVFLNGKFGISLCNPKDKFTKKRGTEIAIGRVKKNSNVEFPNRKDITKKEFIRQFSNFADDTVAKSIFKGK